MDTLNWDDPREVISAKMYFNRCVHAINPREGHQHKIQNVVNVYDHPSVKETKQIFQSDPMIDYEELLNCVEHHITCNEKSCLRKKGGKMVCRYHAPWDLCDHSKLYIDEQGEKKYEPKQNDDRVNTHNRETLMMWRDNIDWQPVLSKRVVINYIAKYDGKSEKGSETFHNILMQVSSIHNPNDTCI